MDLFLDSSTRRLLSGNENRSILCGWDGETGEWRRLALHDETLAPVVEDILAGAQAWQEDPSLRFSYFAQFLGHEDKVLSGLAHIEVARAPYRELLNYADRLPREELRELLADLRRIEWHALYILFLARSDHPEDRERIRREMAESARFGLVIQSAAWATALLEIDGSEGITQLREWYGAGQSRRTEEREAVLAALVVHGNDGDPSLRDPIVELLGEFLRSDPALAPAIVDPLAEWERKDLVELVAALLRESPRRFDTSGTLALRRYLRGVEERSAKEENSLSSGVAPLVTGGLLLLALLLGMGSRYRRGGVEAIGD